MEKKILFIDDEPYFVRSLIEALEDEGYKVDQAVNGTQAIEELEESVPDVIILDIIMLTGGRISDTHGGMRTGLRVHEIIRDKMGLKVPIIFVTVVEDPNAHRAIRQLERRHGIETSAILVKPVLPSELLDEVKNLIGAA